jgi:hypothetical protein
MNHSGDRQWSTYSRHRHTVICNITMRTTHNDGQKWTIEPNNQQSTTNNQQPPPDFAKTVVLFVHLFFVEIHLNCCKSKTKDRQHPYISFIDIATLSFTKVSSTTTGWRADGVGGQLRRRHKSIFLFEYLESNIQLSRLYQASTLCQIFSREHVLRHDDVSGLNQLI